MSRTKEWPEDDDATGGPRGGRTGRRGSGKEEETGDDDDEGSTIEMKVEGEGLFPGGSNHRAAAPNSLLLALSRPRRFVFTTAEPVCIRAERRESLRNVPGEGIRES